MLEAASNGSPYCLSPIRIVATWRRSDQHDRLFHTDERPIAIDESEVMSIRDISFNEHLKNRVRTPQTRAITYPSISIWGTAFGALKQEPSFQHESNVA